MLVKIAVVVALLAQTAAFRLQPRQGVQASAHMQGIDRPRLESSSVEEPAVVKPAVPPTFPGYDSKAFEAGYFTLNDEICEEMEGALPTDIEGTFFRNIPAKYEAGKDLVTHPFDADGMIAAISIKDGKASFRNRFVQTKGYKEEKRYKRRLYRCSVGTQKPGGILANAFNMNFKNVANTNVIYWGKRVLALFEGGLPHLLEPDSLRTVGPYTFKGKVSAGDRVTAHPKHDPVNNRICVFSPDVKSPKVAEISVREFTEDMKCAAERKFVVEGAFSLLHDFGVTENYYVFIQSPIDMDILPLVLGTKTSSDCLGFDENGKSMMYVVPRNDPEGEVKQIELDPFFGYHIANTYEDKDGNIVLDTTWMRRLIMGLKDKKFGNGELKPQWLDVDFQNETPFCTMQRYTVDPKKGSYSRKQLSERHCEFPRINDAFSTKEHKFIYAAIGGEENKPTPHVGLAAMDLEAGTEQLWFTEPHIFVGEPVFAPRKGSTEENDGYVMTVTTNGKDKSSELLVFDAKDLASGPIARSPLPVGLPFGLHGNYAPGVVPDSFDETKRRHKVCKTLDDRQWNEVKGGFSGLGISYDFQ